MPPLALSTPLDSGNSSPGSPVATTPTTPSGSSQSRTKRKRDPVRGPDSAHDEKFESGAFDKEEEEQEEKEV